MKIYRALILIIVSALVTFTFAFVTAHIPALGDEAPEIRMPNTEGDTATLSSLRGKVVLIQFWASWCRTCRVQNGKLASTYKSYKNESFDIGEGFDVFSVSLDTDPELWKAAIKNDNLSWPNHVCDFMKWKSTVVDDYNFTYLPHNILIDQNGVILAKGVNGDQIEELLKSHLSQ